jgi:hypothetical protein
MKVLLFLMLFFFESPGQRKTAREKRNPMFRGTFYKKVPKTPPTVTQNLCKVKLMKMSCH